MAYQTWNIAHRSENEDYHRHPETQNSERPLPQSQLEGFEGPGRGGRVWLRSRPAAGAHGDREANAAPASPCPPGCVPICRWHFGALFARIMLGSTLVGAPDPHDRQPLLSEVLLHRSAIKSQSSRLE